MKTCHVTETANDRTPVETRHEQKCTEGFAHRAWYEGESPEILINTLAIRAASVHLL